MKGTMGYQFVGTPVPTPMFTSAINNATIEEIKNLEDLDIWNHINLNSSYAQTTASL